MKKKSFKKLIYLIFIVSVILIAITLWVLGASNINDKTPSRGVFVYTNEYK